MALRRVLELGRALARGDLELHRIIARSDDERDENETILDAGLFLKTIARLRREVRKALAVLTPRQEAVLRMRFGIEQKREYTLEELGDKFAVTRERIRQIEQRSLQILRNPTRRKPLVPNAVGTDTNTSSI
jgi:RNA polymerase sigma factor (sigma-70 family)